MSQHIRLQSVIAKAGVCSRRKAESLIRQGKIRVNDVVVVTPFYKVDLVRDVVVFNNKRIRIRDKLYLLFHKPSGVTTTKKDPHAKRNVLELLPKKFSHLHPVGRLDKNTQGLLLLTNDGELTFRLTHPSFEIAKVYTVRLDKPLENKDAAVLERGITLEDGPTLPCKIKTAGPRDLTITIRQGRKRQIRRMFDALGYKVVELVRIKEGCLSLGSLKPGKFRILSELEVRRLYAEVGL